MTKNANNDPFGQAFNLTPIDSFNIPVKDGVKDIIAAAHNDSAKNDFEIARANIHGIIDTGTYALSGIARVAEQSQHPRAFEVLATLMNTLLQANKDLLALQKDIRTISESDKNTVTSSGNTQPITQNLYVGSTADFQKIVEQMKNNNDQ